VSYAGTYDPMDPNDPHAVRMNPRLKGLRKKSDKDESASEIRRLNRELVSCQKHFDAVLNERVILTGAVDAALALIDSNDPKVRNRVGTLLFDATQEVERLGREYRGEPDPKRTGADNG
jgi:hypothetical protein